MGTMYYQRQKDDKSALEFANTLQVTPNTAVCFGSYARYFDGNEDGGDIYFGFIANTNITKLIRQVNRTFKNIKIRVITNKELRVSRDATLFGDANGCRTYNWTLFRVELNAAYSKQAKFMLKLTLAEFIRAYCPEYEHYGRMFNVKEQYINSALKAQDSGRYGAWVCSDPSKNYKVPRKVFNMFDDIEKVNDAVEFISYNSMPNVHKLVRILDGSETKEYMRKSIWE